MTARANTPFQDVLKLMRDHQFRRLPVVNKKGKLTGIVSERDLLHAAPSSATSLSIWELQYLLAKVQLKEIMTKDVITTTPDTPV
ncbi:MAG: CBS domain-containing protein, partial [Anaerolineae bacterium]